MLLPEVAELGEVAQLEDVVGGAVHVEALKLVLRKQRRHHLLHLRDQPRNEEAFQSFEILRTVYESTLMGKTTNFWASASHPAIQGWTCGEESILQRKFHGKIEGVSYGG
jgi:hypothetical protein